MSCTAFRANGIAQLACRAGMKLVSVRPTVRVRKSCASKGKAAPCAENTTRSNQPPKALRLTKRLMKMAQRMELKDFLDLCAAFQGMCHNEPEHLAAVQRMLARS